MVQPQGQTCTPHRSRFLTLALFESMDLFKSAYGCGVSVELFVGLGQILLLCKARRPVPAWKQEQTEHGT
eukprot:5381665-Karenia_brevis.AAC.1